MTNLALPIDRRVNSGQAGALGDDCSRTLSRRDFLSAATSFGGFALLGELKAMAKANRPLNVVVVGGGLAGLVAAYELEQQKHKVTLLEADERIGGRVRTHRFADGSYGELGAMRIPTAHDLTRHYIKLFNLRLRAYVGDNPDAYYFVRGKKVRLKNVEQLGKLFRLAAGEKGKSPEQFWEEAITKRLEKLGNQEREDLFSVKPKTKEVLALDQLSLRQLLAEAGLSDEAIEYVLVCYGEEGLCYTAATELLRDEFLEVYSKPLDEIEGGMDSLPKAFVERLQSKPRLGCEVIEIKQDLDRKLVKAIYKEQGEERAVEGDYLICTIPFSILDRVTITPPFSPRKQHAIRVINYDSATKVLVQTKQRFWESIDGIYGGGTLTDLPTGMTFYPSDNAVVEVKGGETVVKRKDAAVSAKSGVLLASYNWGMAARQLAAGTSSEILAQVVRQVGAIHPQLAEPGMVVDSKVWSWDHHRWSAGAYAWFMPGQHTELYQHIIEPEGRIIIAGEHASLAHSWMQGALESGVRAVKEVVGRG
jgi:monoamine oxidase